MLAQLELDGRVAARFVGAEAVDLTDEMQVMQAASNGGPKWDESR